MSGEENAAVVARDKQVAWMTRNIEAMRDKTWLSDKRKAQIMSRDLTLGAIALGSKLNSLGLPRRSFRKTILVYVKRSRNAAREAGLPLPRLSYWPRQTPKRKHRKR